MRIASGRGGGGIGHLPHATYFHCLESVRIFPENTPSPSYPDKSGLIPNNESRSRGGGAQFPLPLGRWLFSLVATCSPPLPTRPTFIVWVKSGFFQKIPPLPPSYPDKSCFEKRVIPLPHPLLRCDLCFVTQSGFFQNSPPSPRSGLGGGEGGSTQGRFYAGERYAKRGGA